MEFEWIGQNLVIRLPAEVDEHSVRELPRYAEEYVREYPVERIVLDFSKVRFMDSTGVGVVLGRWKQMAARGGDVAIWGACGRVRQLLRMAGVEKLVLIRDTEEDACRR